MNRILARLGFSRAEIPLFPVREMPGSLLEIDKWALSRFILDSIVPVVGIHPFPLDELLLMTGAVVALRPKHIFEWGTNVGKSARVFHETAKGFSLDIQIHSIDLEDGEIHQEHPLEQRGMLVRGVPDVTLYQGDGLTTALSICRKLGENVGRPLFFVDGDHSFDSVCRELVGILTFMPEAAVLVHDTFFQTEESGYNIGPYLAIERVLATFTSEYVRIVAGPGLPGMTLIYRIDTLQAAAASGNRR